MTNETVPELPGWVKVLINDAREEGFESGVEYGRKSAENDVIEFAKAGFRSRRW